MLLIKCDLTAYLLILFSLLIKTISTGKNDTEWRPEYPDGGPWNEPFRCGRFLPSYICDPDKIFSPNQQINIDGLLWERARDEICLCDDCFIGRHGIVIQIALMDDYRIWAQPLGNSKSVPSLESFADDLRKKWIHGSCGNDVLILISRNSGQESGGTIVFGKMAKKLLEKSSIMNITRDSFRGSQKQIYESLWSIMETIKALDLNGVKIDSICRKEETIKEEEETTEVEKGEKNDLLLGEIGTVIDRSRENLNDPLAPQLSKVHTFGTSGFIAAQEDDEFKAPQDTRISTSYAFMIVGSLTVILVSLIALFLIIWYYRTKTGIIEPTTSLNLKSTGDEKNFTDIKSVKYEPCKTDEPGLPV